MQPTLPLTPDDRNHLRWLSIAYYVWAALILVFSLGGLLMIGMGAGISATSSPDPDVPPQVVGIPLMFAGTLWIVIAAAMAFLNYLTGRSLVEHRRRTLVFIMAILNCFSIPFGLILGVLTLIVINRPQVAAAFREGQQPVPYRP